MPSLSFYGMPDLPYRPAWDAVQAHLDGCPRCVAAYDAERIDQLCKAGGALNQELNAAFARQEQLARLN